MTKYEELCGAFRQSDDDRIAYRERSLTFMARLLAGFVSYIGAPADRVRFLPPEPRDPNMVYNSLGAAKLDADGWWCAYVQLTLMRAEHVYPQFHALLRFRVLVELDKFTVRIGDSDRKHVVLDGDTTVLEAAYQEAYEGAKDYFASGLERFLDEASKDASRKIGFR